MEGQGVRDDKRTDAVGEEDSGVVQPSGIEEHVPTSSRRGRGGIGGGAAARGAFVTRREAADGLRSSCGRRTARRGRHRRGKKKKKIVDPLVAIIEKNLIGSHHGLNVSHCWLDGSQRWLVVAIAIAGSKGAVMSSMGSWSARWEPKMGSMGGVAGLTGVITGSAPSWAQWEPLWARWEPP